MATATQRRAKAARRRAHAQRTDDRLGMKFDTPVDRARYHERLRNGGQVKGPRFKPFEGQVRFLSDAPEIPVVPSPEPGTITTEQAHSFMGWSRNGSSRAKCSVCGKSEKTTKAGKIGRHGDCTGAGKDPVDA